jgi:hypothetical protein
MFYTQQNAIYKVCNINFRHKICLADLEYRTALTFTNHVLSYFLGAAYQLKNLSCSHKGKGKSIPVTGRGGPQGCERSRLPYFLDSRLTDGGEVFSLMRRPPYIPSEIPGAHFC